ncbi:calcium/sodium antiporter [Methanothermococcus sp.]|uniref:calcium/sodium antiporter n=1 Tax=Methanothermococcus sp. TaxID=2614238 RepID=UPI0025D52199|nr:calcium/sodium antiporter [Methanothermococcus sp.]
MLLSVFVLLIGLVLLNYGSDWFVLGSSRIAKYLNISNFVIGATVVAFGTSLPEIITSVYAAYANLPGIAVGNSLGSCIANIGLILGISALISPIVIKHDSILKNGYIYLIYTILLFILGYNGFGFINGLILFILLLIYIVYTIRNGKIPTTVEEEEIKKISTTTAVIFTIVGLLSIIIGSELFVDGAKNIASFLGVSDKVIGFTLVAFGTSLPELVVSITAVRRKLGDIVLGNVIGSNMANIGCALAFSCMITHIPPVKFEMDINLFLVILMVAYMSKNLIIDRIKSYNINNNYKTNNIVDLKEYSKIGRIEGIFLILIYIVFILKISNIF